MSEKDLKVQNKTFLLNITTPRGIKLSEQVERIIVRCLDGDMGVLPGHIQTSAVLGDGILRIYNEGNEKKLAVFGGVIEIRNNTVNIFTTIAQYPEEIDLVRAEQDRKAAEDAILERKEQFEAQSSNILLRRTLVRIEVGEYLNAEE